MDQVLNWGTAISAVAIAVSSAVAILLKSMSSSYSAMLTDLRIQNTSQQGQIDRLKTEATEARSEHEQCRKEIAELRNRHDSLTRRADGAQAQMSQRMDEVQAAVDDVKKQVNGGSRKHEK